MYVMVEYLGKEAQVSTCVSFLCNNLTCSPLVMKASPERERESTASILTVRIQCTFNDEVIQ